MEKVLFSSFDGTSLNGILTIPEGVGQMRGLFLLMHGIPSEKNEWGFYSDMANVLSQNGFASLRFDFRLNGENTNDGSMKELTLSGMIMDIEAAYQLLRSQFDDDLYVVGTSCGGGVTVKWLNTFKHNIKKCFLMAPVLDYVYEATGVRRETFFAERQVGIVEKLNNIGYLNDDIHYGRAFFNDALIFDGVNEVNQCTTPITIFQGTDDSVVPIELTEQIVGESQRKINFCKVSSADHGFAALGDDDLTSPETKKNHNYVYQKMIAECH